MAYRNGNGLGVDPATATAVVTAGKSIWDAFTGGEWTMHLPPLPYTPDEVAQALEADPRFADQLRAHLEPYSAVVAEHLPTAGPDWQDPYTLAQVALWHAQAPGRDLNIEEEQTRAMVEREMQSREVRVPGTSMTFTKPSPEATQAGTGALIVLGLMGAVLFMARGQ